MVLFSTNYIFKLIKYIFSVFLRTRRDLLNSILLDGSQDRNVRENYKATESHFLLLILPQDFFQQEKLKLCQYLLSIVHSVIKKKLRIRKEVKKCWRTVSWQADVYIVCPVKHWVMDCVFLFLSVSELQEEGINAINLPLSPSHYELDPEDTMLGK